MNFSDELAAMRAAFDAGFAVAPRALTQTEAVLALRVGGDGYAVRLTEISELQREAHVVAVPSGVAALRGVAAFRGVVAPVYDLGVLLGYPPAASLGPVLLVRHTSPLGLALERLDGFFMLAAADLSGSGDTTARRHMRGLAQIDGQARPLIDLASIVEAIVRQGED